MRRPYPRHPNPSGVSDMMPEDPERALSIFEEDGFDPLVRIGVQALLRMTPDRFITGADEVDGPEVGRCDPEDQR